MYTIWHNSRQEGYDFESFMSKANQICEEHQQEDKAAAFAFILYDDFNPEIQNLLYDETYWNSLDTISGNNISIFSIKTKEKRRIKARTSRSNDNLIHETTGQFTRHTLSNSNNDVLSNLFGLNENVKLPGLLFFQVLEGEIIDNFYVELKERNTESAFNEIKDYLIRCAKTVKQITEENKRNYREIFDLLKSDLASVKMLKAFTKKIPALRTIGQLFGLIT